MTKWNLFVLFNERKDKLQTYLEVLDSRICTGFDFSITLYFCLKSSTAQSGVISSKL